MALQRPRDPRGMTMISVGEKLPEVKLKLVRPEGMEDAVTSKIFEGKRIVLFAVPGAFTPTCSNNHLPGYLENHDAILAKGVRFVGTSWEPWLVSAARNWTQRVHRGPSPT